MLQERFETEIEKRSDSEIVQGICSGNPDEEEVKRRISILIRRHPGRFQSGLRKVKYGDRRWERARENLGYEDLSSLALNAVEYLAEVPQKGKYVGKRRICTFLEDETPFGEWMSSKLFGLARQIRSEIQEEKENLQERRQKTTESIGSRKDHTRKKDEIGETHADLARLANKVLVQLDSSCRSTLEAFFSSDEPGLAEDARENVLEVENCLRRCAEIMGQEGINLAESEVPRGKAELWNCAQKLSDRFQSLILHRSFLNLKYWKVGRALSENNPEEYESWAKYERAEYDWAQRIKNKCKRKVEEQCSREAAEHM